MLKSAPSDPEADLAALMRLARWAVRYTPLVALDGADGLWLDTTGCDHLHGGEAALLEDLSTRLGQAGRMARLALAGTPGGAHALARYGTKAIVIVPQDAAALATALDPLPVESLRLTAEAHGALRRTGLDRIGLLRRHMMGLRTDQHPRGHAGRSALSRRIGTCVLRRLDQAMGIVAEPIAPIPAHATIAHRMSFAEPLATPEGAALATRQLVDCVSKSLEAAGEGAVRLDLLFAAPDQSMQAIRVGLSRPSRTSAHLMRLLQANLDQIDFERGTETIHLIASATARLSLVQVDAAAPPEAAVSELIDSLTARLGQAAVWQGAASGRRFAELALKAMPPLASPPSAADCCRMPRPPRLLDPPRPIEVMALLPDCPPAQFIWRRQRHRIRVANGPERVVEPWWRCRATPDEAITPGVRDYYVVEDDAGRRFWLMRRGDGIDPRTGDLSWFLQGLF